MHLLEEDHTFNDSIKTLHLENNLYKIKLISPLKLKNIKMHLGY